MERESSIGRNQFQQQQLLRRRWAIPILATLLISFLIISAYLFSSSSSSLRLISSSSFSISQQRLSHSFKTPLFVESKIKPSPILSASNHSIPRLAYLISGSVGDGESLKRTLFALYHPHNTYVVHLDLEASPAERLALVAFVKENPVFDKFQNVRVIVRANLVTYKGPTMVTNTLNAAAILLKEGGDWDWFINLSSSDYPLITQDDILHTFASYPRHFNFIEHTSKIGWKETHRARPVIIDPGLYKAKKSDIIWVTERRGLPTAFKLFTGSAWMMLSRQFIEYCVWGWDNLPRTVLMYYANFVSSPESYFHTVICNAEEFQNTTVNHDLHLISWDRPPKQHPHILNKADFPKIAKSNAPFARKFHRDGTVLDMIDQQLLHREKEGFVPGSWFEGNTSNLEFKPVKDVSDLRPGPGAEKLKLLIDGLVNADGFDRKHCI
ncbi:Xylosyltransferase, family GT14 [Zostera marina]|uniref:Xylosyltransferase, family GT14 n=1 Tax=Zostera marina TaxID=29655 RepID=A0A0K9NYS8_ZOSMR|nr:Xylosyltransferase, family GT14 [Zostera marina]